MKKLTIRIALLAFVSVCIGIMNASTASAGQAVFPVNQSLHFNSGVNASSWSGFTMTDSTDSNFSAASGYVIPNMQGGSYAPVGGAVGETALGISRSTTSNYNKKVALFCFLQKKNGVSAASRNSICAGRNWTASSGINGMSATQIRAWEKMGSALIVHQLLNTSPASGRPASAKTITSAQWNDLKRRLVDNSDVVMAYDAAWTTFHWNGTVHPAGYYMSNLVNTAGVKMNSGGTFDAMAVTYGETDSTADKTDRVWTFTSASSGTIYYALVLNCANPIGGLPGLPDIPPPDPDEYLLTPTLTAPANGGTVNRSQSISASGRVVNSGDAAGSKNWYITRLTYDTGNNPSNTSARTSNANGSNLCNEFAGNDGCSVNTHTNTFGANATVAGSAPGFTVPSNAQDGTEYCFVVSVRNPTHNANDPVWSHSAMNCVTVSFKYSLTPGLSLATTGVIDPGDSVNGRSTVTNNGNPSDSVNWRITMLVYAPGVTPTNPTAANQENAPCTAFTGENSCAATRSTTQSIASAGAAYNFTATVPAGTAAGSRVCFVTSVNKPTQASTTSQWRHSAIRCLSVRTYSLTPILELDRNDGSAVDPGTAGDITISVEHGGGDATRTVEWRVTEYVYNENSTLDSDDKEAQPSSANRPCVAFTNADRTDCTDDPDPFWSVERTFTASPPVTNGPSNLRYRVPDSAPIGTQICYVASVSRPTANSSPVWRHSAMVCVVVGKQPKVQVWGGDVRSGGGISTSLSTIDNRTYGSWVEYAALSKARNEGLASGAGLNRGAASVGQSSWSNLTFANTGTAPACTFGCYNFSVSAAALAGQFAASSANTTLVGTRNLNSLSSGVYYVASGTTLNLAATTVSHGKTIIIVANTGATVTIDGDIEYEDVEYKARRTNPGDVTIRELPQVIIKASTINIRNAAERVDAWLLATNSTNTGTLNTCSNVGVTARLTTTICDNPLTINGPVVADTVYLRRTAGSEVAAAQRGDPAEVFNLRADAYMWASVYGSRSEQVQTVYSKELSPRF